jgi:hypothetical protein
VPTMERSNQRLVIALASALGLALLAIAFLIGRISAKPAVITVAAPPPGVAVASSESVPTPPASVAATPETSDAPLPLSEPTVSWTPGREIASTTALSPALAPMPTTNPGRPGLSGEQPQIAAYFDQVDRIEDMGAGDPQAFATSMVQSMSSGDFSGFDDLLSKARAQRQRLQAISPPRACLEHHRLALTLSADSVAMLERLKAALMKGDSTALLTIASEGKTLETQANQLKAMSESIKRQAGL